MTYIGLTPNNGENLISIIGTKASAEHALASRPTSIDIPSRKGLQALLQSARNWNYPVIISHVFLFTLVIVVLTLGYQPIESRGAQVSPTASLADNSTVPTVDEVASASVSATVAQSAGYLVASNVQEHANSVAVRTSLAQSSDANYLSKPQLVGQGQRHGVTKYTVKQGDTVPSVAALFQLTAQTIKWANNLSSDALAPGQELSIPATDGVLYTVQAGDTTDSIASKFGVSKDRIVSFNDLELGGLSPGQQVIVPGAQQQQAPGASSSSKSSSAATTSGFSFGASPVFGGNGYAYGYCTYWAASRRAQVGRPVPNNWGNAATWADGARAMGMRVDRVPEVGAVMQNGGGWGGLGHVAFVERVNPDGSWTISEMNFSGWNVVDQRTLSAADAASYNFIH